MATRCFLIGEGDDRVEYWKRDFDEPMERITQVIQKAREHKVVIKWKNIIPKNDDWRRLKRSRLRNRATAEMLLSSLKGVYKTGKAWGGDSPGRSGVWICITVESTQRRRVLALVRDLAMRLEEEWAKTKPGAEENSPQMKLRFI